MTGRLPTFRTKEGKAAFEFLYDKASEIESMHAESGDSQELGLRLAGIKGAISPGASDALMELWSRVARTASTIDTMYASLDMGNIPPGARDDDTMPPGGGMMQ